MPTIRVYASDYCLGDDDNLHHGRKAMNVLVHQIRNFLADACNEVNQTQLPPEVVNFYPQQTYPWAKMATEVHFVIESNIADKNHFDHKKMQILEHFLRSIVKLRNQSGYSHLDWFKSCRIEHMGGGQSVGFDYDFETKEYTNKWGDA